MNFFAVNRGNSPIDLDIDLRDFGRAEVIEHIFMAHQDITAVNTVENPTNVVPHSTNQTKVGNGHARSSLPGYSWNVIRLRMK